MLVRRELQMDFRSSVCPKLWHILPVPGFKRLDRFLRKGSRSGKTLQRHYCGREGQQGAYREELWFGSRRMANPQLLGHEIRDRILEQAIYGGGDFTTGGRREIECGGSSQ